MHTLGLGAGPIPRISRRVCPTILHVPARVNRKAYVQLSQVHSYHTLKNVRTSFRNPKDLFVFGIRTAS